MARESVQSVAYVELREDTAGMFFGAAFAVIRLIKRLMLPEMQLSEDKKKQIIKKYFADKFWPEPGFYQKRTAEHFLKIKRRNGAGITIYVNWVRQDLRNTQVMYGGAKRTVRRAKRTAQRSGQYALFIL